jgi:TIR domain
MTFALIDSIDI